VNRIDPDLLVKTHVTMSNPDTSRNYCATPDIQVPSLELDISLNVTIPTDREIAYSKIDSTPGCAICNLKIFRRTACPQPQSTAGQQNHGPE
jgi:hypothetical protein